MPLLALLTTGDVWHILINFLMAACCLLASVSAFNTMELNCDRVFGADGEKLDKSTCLEGFVGKFETTAVFILKIPSIYFKP